MCAAVCLYYSACRRAPCSHHSATPQTLLLANEGYSAELGSVPIPLFVPLGQDALSLSGKYELSLLFFFFFPFSLPRGTLPDNNPAVLPGRDY